jgi:pimeloyl-ACP methyl ester carboxylesterase
MREPFRIAVSDDVLDDLQNRLANTRLPPDAGPAGWNDGVEPAYLADLIAYWRSGYDWRAQEHKLNQFHQFRATIDGTRLHFVHERGAGPSPMPLVLTHGYPDCFYRFHKLIPLLIDPSAHGGDAADAFDVVVPSLPGYAFSESRTQSGGAFGFGSLWHGLMTDELGYGRYGAHGGDWGSTVTEQLARSHSSAVIGIHLTDIPFWHTFQKPKDLSSADPKHRLIVSALSRLHESGGRTLDHGSREGMGGLDSDTCGNCPIPKRHRASTARMGEPLLQRAALDRDAARRPFCGARRARMPG